MVAMPYPDCTTLMNCGTVKHVSVDCAVTLLHFGVVERSVKLVWVSINNNANAHYPCGSLSALAPYYFAHSECAHDSYCPKVVVQCQNG